MNMQVTKMSKLTTKLSGGCLLALLFAATTASADVTNLGMTVTPMDPAVGDLVLIEIVATHDARGGEVVFPLPKGLEYVAHTAGLQYMKKDGKWQIPAGTSPAKLQIQARLVTSNNKQPLAVPGPKAANQARPVMAPAVLLTPQGCVPCQRKPVCCTDVNVLIRGCGPTPCFQSEDSCINIRMPVIHSEVAIRPNLTTEGTNAFVNIFGIAAARGVENATIRAMNATKVCPTGKNCQFPCDWLKAKVGDKNVVFDPDGNAFDLLTGDQVDPITGAKLTNPTAKLVWKGGQMFIGDGNGQNLKPVLP